MTNKKTYKEPEGYDRVRALFNDAGLIDTYSKKEKKSIMQSHKRIKYRILKKAGKIGLFTTIMLVILSSWNKLITKVFGKVVVISMATSVTVGGGYYIIKTKILTPQIDKKIEEKIEKKTIISEKIKKISKKVKPGFYFQFDDKGSNVTKEEKEYFLNHIYRYLYAKETKKYVLVIKIAKLENIYSVSLSLQDIVTMKEIDTKGTMVKEKHNAAKECKKMAQYFREKYLSHQ